MAKFKVGEEVLLVSKSRPQYNGQYVVQEARRHGDYCTAPAGMCGLGDDAIGYHLGFNIEGDDFTLWDESIIHDVNGLPLDSITVQ